LVYQACRVKIDHLIVIGSGVLVFPSLLLLNSSSSPFPVTSKLQQMFRMVGSSLCAKSLLSCLVMLWILKMRQKLPFCLLG